MTSRASLLAGLIALAAVLGYAAIADSYSVFLIATISLTAIACIGLNVLLGLAGQISLGHVGFMAIGAYATVLLMEKAGWPYLAATAASIVLVSIIGGLLAMPALRVRGPYLAMVTIAFGFIVEHVTIEWQSFTGGGNGLILSTPVTVFGYPLSERSLAIAGAILVFVGVVLFDRLKRSGWGYAMRAARDSEVATRSVGIDLVSVRTMAFVISAAAMALAGALFAPLQGYISPSSFPFLQSILLLFAVMIGGAGSAIGSVIALFADPWHALIFAAVYLVYMQVEAYFLTPRVMNKAVAVPGALVVIGALAGGTLLGLLGALVAVPVTASILIIINQVWLPRQDARV